MGGSTVRMCEGSRLLNGREASRCRRVGEGSADVRWLRRVHGVTGGSDVVEGIVRARAMLQALAPRSRTVGK